jgi:hypothetical protein
VAALTRSLLAGALCAGALAAVPASAAAWDEGAYWGFADQVQKRIDDAWSPRVDQYRVNSPSVDTMLNANELLVHSAAALRGLDPSRPVRADGRARAIATMLVQQSPPWLETVTDPAPGSQPHQPGWVSSTQQIKSAQHLVVDGEVTDALAMAWLARDAIGLDPAVQALIQDRLRRVADGPYWRYPTLRLNQVNWYAEVYNAAVTATGDPTWFQRDLRGQLESLIRSIRRPAAGTAGSLGPGMQFHYIPDGTARSQLNVESTEYANIVASVIRFYDTAVAHGMRPLAATDEALLRRWMTRVLAGYWTHAGYLNWDTGFGFGRWHQTKKLGLAQQALLGIAAGGRLSPSRREARWAKYILDRSFELYARKLPPDEGVAPGLFYPLPAHPQSDKQAVLGAARIAANAARASVMGLGSRGEAAPPPLYSFDPATGRLAVTTPRYNTAITAVTHGAYPYGGLDLARLYDDRQEVAATLGARQPSSFGVVVRTPGGRARLVTARPASDSGGRRPLRLVRAPWGVGSAGSPLRPFAGPFDVVKVTGRARSADADARSTYTFRRNWILGEWTVQAVKRKRVRSAEVLFPSTGGTSAAVWAVLKGGIVVPVTAARPVKGVRGFWVQSAHSGYAVIPVDRVKGSVASIIQPKRQPSAPFPGPTLSIRLTDRLQKKHPVRFAARIVVARDIDAAKRAIF